MENWKPQLPSGQGLDGPTVHALETTFKRWLDRIQSQPTIANGDELIGIACSSLETNKSPISDAPMAAHRHLMKTIWILRRARSDIFPSEIFSDPAWDLLIDLYLAKLESRKISVSSACIASCSPPTTALRYIKMLVEKGLLLRHPDRYDGRRVFLELSADAEKMMVQWSTAAIARMS